jgi:hypothetical protein
MENHLFLMGKSTISMAMFNGFLYVYQRVTTSVIWLCLKMGIPHNLHLSE